MEDYSNTSFAFVNIVGMGGVGKLPDKSAPCSSLFQHLGGPKNFTATVAFEVVRGHQEKPRKFVGVMGQYFYLFLEVDLKVNR